MFFHGGALLLVESFQGVIAPFYIDVGLGGIEKLHRSFPWKDAGKIDGLQGGKDTGAVRFAVDGSGGSLELVDAGVGIHANQQCIALISRLLEVGGMTQVENIKATVCHDKSSAS